jgi:hypothetical protein
MKRIAWIIDYYFLYFMYNPRKIDRYHQRMINKYGDKYMDQIKRRK